MDNKKILLYKKIIGGKYEIIQTCGFTGVSKNIEL